MIIGADVDDGSHKLVASPLLTSDACLLKESGTWTVQPEGSTVDLNPYALHLLGIDRNERDDLVRLIEKTPAVDEARVPEDRAEAILSILAESGVEGLDQLDHHALRAHNGCQGVHNTAMIIIATSSTKFTRMLLEDLQEMLSNPDLLSSGPASVMLGRSPAKAVPLPEPHPAVLSSTLTQDQAVTSAMDNTFTVVTGPPGTGKSQVLANVVAAAVSRGETVLFASKNNWAVDVVFDRLALASPNACIVRAGVSSRRGEVASSIVKMLATPRQRVDPTAARRDWDNVAGRVRAVHGVLHQRARLEGEISQLDTEISEGIELLPEKVDVDVDRVALDNSLTRVRAALDAFGGRLGLFRRWTKHNQRLERARDELSSLCDLVGFNRKAATVPLRSVAEKPKRSLAPRRDLATIEETLNMVRSVQDIRVAVNQKKDELSTLAVKHALDDRLHAMGRERIEAARNLLDARWEQIRRDNPAARTAAGKLAESLDRTRSRTRSAHRFVPEALGAIPVWGVTNLSARTNLPLVAGLFDLVVIDEASQCDVASAFPLLTRARRAMIIGDRRQLTHITSLGQARERIIAQRWGLSENRADEFSYRSRSCFGLASSRVDESPLLLELHFRSHPSIIGFSNEHFYDGRLEPCSDSRPPGEMPAIEWIRVDGASRKGPRGRSMVNPQEAKELSSHLIKGIHELRGLGLTVGVVTPYRAQVELISDYLSKALTDSERRDVTVATAHRFQGDERDVMYFSPVIGLSMTERQAQFASDANLINVALTRARRRLVIVGNIEACLKHRNALADLARYVSRLEVGGFDSPVEQALHEALLERGVTAETGVIVAGHRLDLAVKRGSQHLDIECDGAAFHVDRDLDCARDRDIEARGWKVIRFSGRRLTRDLTGCTDDILSALDKRPVTVRSGASCLSSGPCPEGVHR